MKLYDWGQSTFSVSSHMDNQISSRGKDLFNFNASDGNAFSLVGLNAGKIPEMRDAIHAWVTNIQSHVESFKTDVTRDEAIKSAEVSMAVEEYLKNVKTYCMNLCTYLLAFSDKLKDVYNAYEENMKTLAGAVNEQGAGNATGEEYVDNKVQSGM